MNERTFHHRGAHKLEDPERRKWLPPEDLVRRLDLQPGTDVADVGVGTGYFALPIAEAVKPGAVYGVDLQPEMLARLAVKSAEAGVSGTVRPVQGDAAATGLPDASVDRVLLANVWHELDDHPAALREAARLLRPGGRVAILDWSPDAAPPPGPPSDHRVSPAAAVAALEEQGWRIASVDPFGLYHYLVLTER